MNIEGKKPSAPMSFHVCMKITTALDMLFARDGWDDPDQHGPSTIRTILDYDTDESTEKIAYDLTAYLSKGQQFIPGKGCDNNLPLGRCLGHVKRGIQAGKLHS